MTDTKPTLEEQIACMSDIVAFGNDMRLSILASLKELQSIRSAELPVEPECLRVKRSRVAVHGLGGSDKQIIEYIDSLKSFALKEKERADTAKQDARDSALETLGYLRDKEKAESKLAAMYKAAEEHAGHELGLWPLGAVAAVGRLESRYAALRGRLMEPDDAMLEAGCNEYLWRTQAAVGLHRHVMELIFKAMSAVILEGK